MAVYFQRFVLWGEDVQGKKHEREHRAGLDLLREGLAREYPQIFWGWSEKDLERELDKGDKGKPFLKHYPQIQFNISHGKDMVVCGIDGLPLGVDVEAIRPVKPTVFRRVLTAGEQDYLEKSRETEGEHGWYRDFFRLWTLKESFAKAIGQGLAVDFTRFSFRLPPLFMQEGCGDALLAKPLLLPGRKEEEERRKSGGHSTIFRMREVEGCLEEMAEVQGEQSWNQRRFFQTVIDGEYVISCCLSIPEKR